MFVIKPIFATSGFPTPGWVTAIGAVFVIVVMVAAAGAGIIREVMTHLLITISKIGLKATFTSAFWQSSYEINMVICSANEICQPLSSNGELAKVGYIVFPTVIKIYISKSP